MYISIYVCANELYLGQFAVMNNSCNCGYASYIAMHCLGKYDIACGMEYSASYYRLYVYIYIYIYIYI